MGAANVLVHMKTQRINENRKPFEACKFCGLHVNLDDEGVTFQDGTCAHEQCNDSNEFQAANASDMCD